MGLAGSADDLVGRVEHRHDLAPGGDPARGLDLDAGHDAGDAAPTEPHQVEGVGAVPDLNVEGRGLLTRAERDGADLPADGDLRAQPGLADVDDTEQVGGLA